MKQKRKEEKGQFTMRPKNKVYIIFGAMFIVIALEVGMASATWTYQQDANSVICAGDWSGTYPCANVYDNDFGTYGRASQSSGVCYYAQYYANYTAPAGAATAKWEVKYGSSPTPNNHTLTSTNACFIQSPIQLRIVSNGTFCPSPASYGECWNGTAWASIFFGANNDVYEDDMWWDDCNYHLTDCKASAWAANSIYCLDQSITTTGDCMVIDADNVTLNGKGFTLTGDGGSGDSGIYALTRQNITIKNFANISNFGGGLLTAAGVFLKNVNNTIISNSTVYGNQIGVYVNGTNNSILNNSVRQNLFQDIYISNPFTGSTLIYGNTLGSTASAGSQAIAIQGAYVNITKNTIYDTNGAAIKWGTFFASYHATVDSNIINQTVANEGQIYMANSLNNQNTINNNTLIVASGGYGIRLVSDANIITNNNITGTGNALYLSSSTVAVNVIKNNNISGSTPLHDDGLVVGGTPYNYLSYENSYGSINWTQSNISSSTNLTFPGSLNIGTAWASFQPVASDHLNASTNITLYNTGVFTTPIIKRDGITCSDCVILSSVGDTYTFNVSGWSNYSIVESIDTTPPTVTVNSVQNTSISTTTHVFNITTSEAANCTLNLNGASVNESFVYQETADSLLNDTGIGLCPFIDSANLSDGDWTTYATKNESCTVNNMLLNYTKPLNAISAVWQVSDNLIPVNFTIPSACYNEASLMLLVTDLRSGSNNHVSWRCYNGTTWVSLSGNRVYASPSRIYEEAIFWNIQSTSHTWTQTLTEGNYSSINYTCEDNSSNSGTSSTYWLNVDSTSPTVAWASVTCGIGLCNQFWVNTTANNVTFNVTVDPSEIGNCVVDINGTTYSMTKVSGAKKYYYTWTVPADGNYTLRGSCNDTANNTGYTDYSWYYLDTTPPVITFTSGTNTTTSSDPHSISWTTDSLANCTLKSNTATYTLTTNTTFNQTVQGYANGNYTFNLTCDDAYGNSRAMASAFWLNISDYSNFSLPTRANNTQITSQNYYEINVSSSYYSNLCWLNWNGVNITQLSITGHNAYINLSVNTANNYTYLVYCNSSYSGIFQQTEQRKVEIIPPIPPDVIPPQITSSTPPDGFVYPDALASSLAAFTIYANEPLSDCRYSNIQSPSWSNMINFNSTSGYSAYFFDYLPANNSNKCYYVGCNDTSGNIMTTAYRLCVYVSVPGQGGSGGGAITINKTVVQYGAQQFTPTQIFSFYPRIYGGNWSEVVTSSTPIYMCGFDTFNCSIISSNQVRISYTDNQSINFMPIIEISAKGYICPTEDTCYTYGVTVQEYNVIPIIIILIVIYYVYKRWK